MIDTIIMNRLEELLTVLTGNQLKVYFYYVVASDADLMRTNGEQAQAVGMALNTFRAARDSMVEMGFMTKEGTKYMLSNEVYRK